MRAHAHTHARSRVLVENLVTTNYLEDKNVGTRITQARVVQKYRVGVLSGVI